MRRLPIFFLLDVSESMIGPPLTALEEGMAQIVTALRRDPHALETVHLSVIAFAGKAEVIARLVELTAFYPPRLPLGGGTALGKALELLMTQLDSQLRRQSATAQGDWQPLVFLLTDGKPTDQPRAAVARWRADYARRATLVAITLGGNADRQLLQQLTPNVLAYEGSSEADFRRFIDWITASVTMRSQSLGTAGSGSGVQLAKPGDGLKPLDDDQPLRSDPDVVALTGRCQQTQRPYLIKYLRLERDAALQAYLPEERFMLAGCFPLSESYFDWSAEGAQEQINTALLQGVPGCPHCGNLTTIALCGHCSQLMCVNGPGEAICPWCGNGNRFVGADSEDEGMRHFNLSRGQG